MTLPLVTDVLDRVARSVSVDAPSSWAGAIDAEHVEIRDDFLVETAEEILDRLDLPSPIGSTYTITGDGSGSYSLPTDFSRLTRDPMAVYESTTIRRALIGVTDDNSWQYLQDIGTTGAERFYRITGFPEEYTMEIYRDPSTPITVYVNYVTDKWVGTPNAGTQTPTSSFTADTQTLLLPRRLVEAGTIARWRERYGVVSDDKRMEFESLITRYSNDSRNRRSVRFGGAADPGKPWDIPVPDYIPSS